VMLGFRMTLCTNKSRHFSAGNGGGGGDGVCRNKTTKQAKLNSKQGAEAGRAPTKMLESGASRAYPYGLLTWYFYSDIKEP